MRSLSLFGFALFIAQATISPALGEIVRCSGVALGTQADPYDFEVSVDIVLPEPTEYNKTLTIVQGKDGQFVAILGSSIGSYGVGMIEEATTISDQRTKAKQTSKKTRYQFIVTQKPSDSSLTGFYLKSGHPIVVRADISDTSRRFSLASTMEYRGLQIFGGRCL